MKTVQFSNIQYDTDGQKLDLPATIDAEMADDFDPDCDGADLISDKTGWCVFGFDCTEITHRASMETV